MRKIFLQPITHLSSRVVEIRPINLSQAVDVNLRFRVQLRDDCDLCYRRWDWTHLHRVGDAGCVAHTEDEVTVCFNIKARGHVVFCCTHSPSNSSEAPPSHENDATTLLAQVQYANFVALVTIK